MERVRLTRHQDLDEFLATAGPFLAAREAEHNLMLGIISSVRDSDAYDGPPQLLSVADERGAVLAAAIRTPPHNMVLSEVNDLGAVGLLAGALAAESLPGMVGPPAAVRAFADAWTGARGQSWSSGREERIYRLERVVEPMPGPGAARLADAADRETVGDWLRAFEREALNEEAEAGLIDRALDSWLRIGSRRFWLWDVDGRPVSMVGSGGRTPTGVRIGPVYTPPSERGRGYASRLTAWVSQAMLDEGRRWCFLYTDLGNPTANHIYRAIGYEPVTDALMVIFRD
jgi:predicted GNAT family acetyltransferase